MISEWKLELCLFDSIVKKQPLSPPFSKEILGSYLLEVFQ